MGRRTQGTHLRLLHGSDEIELATDEETGQVVGFATAITDGVLSAYIPLFEVLPAYRGRGVASELVRRLLKKLDHHYMIDLLCDADLQPFFIPTILRELPKRSSSPKRAYRWLCGRNPLVVGGKPCFRIGRATIPEPLEYDTPTGGQ